ncbi:SAM-dependent methyltransferase [uncultured Methanocorpusculum sp.]|nr:SAM-dependent methyltransferase [uncultured Methanocorpusculum sp.]
MKIRKISKRSLQNSASEPWVDTTRRVYCEGEYAFVPVKEGYPFDGEIPDRRPYSGPGYQRMGDTLLLHGDAPTADEFAALVAWENPACVIHAATHEGVMRIPTAVVLFGEPHDVTFREAGITYTLDPSKVMFSQGNRGEKLRRRSLVKPGERIADMFAGIGYFTLSVALAGGNVHAVEINPVSFAYLQKNIEANGLAGRVTPELGDCREKLSGIYDRILMGHFEAPEFLQTALDHAGPGTVLHVHGVGDRKNDITETLEGAGFTYIISEHKVKKYAGRLWHSVWDVNLV